MDSAFRRNDEHGEPELDADLDSAWIECRRLGLVNPGVQFSALIGLEQAPIGTGLRPWSWRQVHPSSASMRRPGIAAGNLNRTFTPLRHPGGGQSDFRVRCAAF